MNERRKKKLEVMYMKNNVLSRNTRVIKIVGIKWMEDREKDRQTKGRIQRGGTEKGKYMEEG